MITQHLFQVMHICSVVTLSYLEANFEPRWPPVAPSLGLVDDSCGTSCGGVVGSSFDGLCSCECRYSKDPSTYCGSSL